MFGRKKTPGADKTRERAGFEVRRPARCRSAAGEGGVARRAGLLLPRFPRRAAVRCAGRDDRCQPPPLHLAVGSRQHRLSHQRELRHGPLVARRPPDRRGDRQPARDRARSRRDDAGPALCGRPAIPCAPRLFPPRRKLLAGDAGVGRPAHLDRDDLSQRCRGRRRDLVPAGRDQDRPPPRPVADMEQHESRRQPQHADAARGHAGDRGHEVHRHQVVPRTRVDQGAPSAPSPCPSAAACPIPPSARAAPVRSP